MDNKVKEIPGRLILKHDIESNWNRATTFVPKQGEIVIYDIDAVYSYERFKIGDGVTTVGELPFYLEDQAIEILNKIDYLTQNTTKVTQSAAITSSGNYPVLLGYNTSTSAVTDTVNKTATLNYNPSTSALTTGNIIVSSGYGTELPSSGVEGQVFFLVID